jgi:hypothetical protein
MFRVRPFENRTLTWWRDEREDIDLSPVYQRKGNVWNKTDRQFLVDSILNEFDIPKIYIADFTYIDTPLNEKKKKYAVVDGRQRLEAIFAFFDNLFPISDSFEYIQDSSVSVAGLTYRDLQREYPKIASKFDNFNLTVMSIITDEDARINDLFVRLNKSKPLTGSELRNAMKGAVPGLIRQIADHEFFKNRIRFNTNRMQEFNVAAKILLLEFLGRPTDTKKRNLDRLIIDESIQAETDNIEAAAMRSKQNLSSMCDVFVERDDLLRSQGPVTLYYWLIRDLIRDGKSLSSVRPFLVSFNADLSVNRIWDPGEQGHDPELAAFAFLARSVNDSGSLTSRYKILRERYDSYVSSRAQTELAI